MQQQTRFKDASTCMPRGWNHIACTLGLSCTQTHLAPKPTQDTQAPPEQGLSQQIIRYVTNRSLPNMTIHVALATLWPSCTQTHTRHTSPTRTRSFPLATLRPSRTQTHTRHTSPTRTRSVPLATRVNTDLCTHTNYWQEGPFLAVCCPATDINMLCISVFLSRFQGV